MMKIFMKPIANQDKSDHRSFYFFCMFHSINLFLLFFYKRNNEDHKTFLMSSSKYFMHTVDIKFQSKFGEKKNC